MYIEKISIKSFGALRDYECDYSKGINVIEGPNESGKSTVGAFIKFVFFGLSALSDGNSVSERKKYQSWEDGSACGSIELVCKEKKYRIERSIIPALNGFGKEIVKTVDLESGVITLEVDEALLEERRKNLKIHVQKTPKGVLTRYSNTVASTKNGAVIL